MLNYVYVKVFDNYIEIIMMYNQNLNTSVNH
ncbi:hypothetical protein SAMN05444267_10813 [Chryseobacterium polytrichastri]|uniref:Uncharacterized protein n=1 Tax=Chryseobacterium polytrichastri TaxID=1302687 RepID=A0A1M7L362_9FLAO|nr:hypothetical protein SAMN05444267_10813 [Chryseobacterium polytrichastri]